MITVWTSRLDHGARIVISDEGPGVPAAEQGLIFDKFYRAASTAAERQGTGLGLSITQGLIGAMHGQVIARDRSDGRAGLEVTIDMAGAA